MANFKDCVTELAKLFYNRRFPVTGSDSLLKRNAKSVKGFYKGYPYIVQWENGKEWRNSNMDAAIVWCQENCKGNFTTHIHRVTKTSSFGTENEWIFDEIGGTDYCFWAFIDESDAVMFSLVW